MKALFFSRNASVAEPSTLIFIDEIHNSEKAVSALRTLERAMLLHLLYPVTGQELLARSSRRLEPPVFWVREKNQSQAEVDYVVPFNGQVIPVEVKSGPSGRLRSLHQYVEQSGCPMALRLYAGPLRADSLETPAGHPFRLVSLPYFLAAQVERYLAWMENG